MRKKYIIPNEKVVDLGLEGQLLQGIVSGNGPTDDDGLEDLGEEGMEVRAQRNMWDNQW